jgi:hypothetical protein
MTMVLHSLGLHNAMDTWGVAMGVLWNMASVLSLCLGYGHGATWFRFAQHHGLLQRSHGSLILVYGKCHGWCLCAWGMAMALHGLGMHNTMDTWAVATGVLWNMTCVVSLCLGHDHGATWFRFA